MKSILISLLLLNSLLFSSSAIGGITYSTIETDMQFIDNASGGETPAIKFQYLRGFKFGYEINLNNKALVGFTYTQRGYLQNLDWEDMLSSLPASEQEEWDELVEEADELGINFSFDLDWEDSWTINYLTTYLMFPVPVPLNKLDLLIGVEAGMFISGENDGDASLDMTIEGESEIAMRESWNENIDREDWDDMGGNIDFGLTIGAQYLINNQISLRGTYYFGLMDWADDLKNKNRALDLIVSYKL